MAELSEHTVSLCIASYNMADTIEESLTSITRDLPENFEIVVVDQSTDGSRAIIEDIAERSDLPFKTLHTEYPLGVGHARNLAVCEATGDIVITHVDADDWYDSEYFPALAELYLLLREQRGGDFFFSCSNMNISSREHMKGEYLLTSLPIGANEKEYRWRALNDDDFLELRLPADVSGRIKLSDRKTLFSRMQRTYRRHLGMYMIGYSTRRIVEEDIVLRSWPLHSRLFRAAILPLVWFHTLFKAPLCNAPSTDLSLQEYIARHSYTFDELREEYDIESATRIRTLIEQQ